MHGAVDREPGGGRLVVAQRGHGRQAVEVLLEVLEPHLEERRSAAVISTELTTVGFLEALAARGVDLEGRVLSGEIAFRPVYALMDRGAPRRNQLRKVRRERGVKGRHVVLVDAFSRLLSHHFGALPLRRAWKEVEACLRFFRGLADAGSVVVLTFDGHALDERVVALFEAAADERIVLGSPQEA